MKKWTKKFLNGKPIGLPRQSEIKVNSKNAEKTLEIPAKLWLELSENYVLTNDLWEIGDIRTAFMAGVAVGWAEKSKKIK